MGLTTAAAISKFTSPRPFSVRMSKTSPTVKCADWTVASRDAFALNSSPWKMGSKNGVLMAVIPKPMRPLSARPMSTENLRAPSTLMR